LKTIQLVQDLLNTMFSR